MRMINEQYSCPPATNNLRWLLVLATAALLGACNSGREPTTASPGVTPPPGVMTPPTSPPPPPWYPSSLEPLQGYFVGDVTIGGIDYPADGLITADGLVRIHISGSSTNMWELKGSAQLIGHVVADASQASGSGTIVGEGCALASGRFCAETADSEIGLRLTAEAGDGTITGEIEVATSGGDETWQLVMHWPYAQHSACLTGPCYLERASLALAEGLYYVELAEFGGRFSTLMSVDAGRLFFQDPASGCVGNGTLSPHLDGALNVYDVTLTLEICNGAFAYLNGELEGLATIDTFCPTIDCTWLPIYLASAEEAPSRTAVTFWWRR